MVKAGLIMWWLGAFWHPFHVSVTQMEYKEEDKALQISSKVFLDDLEQAYNEHYGTKTDLWEMRDDAETDSLLGAFFTHHLKIWINGKQEEVVYLGNETDLDATWGYFEIYRVRKIKELKVSYTFGMAQFDDQVNLVHLEYGEEGESVRLDRRTTEETISFD